MAENINRKPLKGIRVLDMTHILAGPYCTMILKNLGAEVIKIEPPNIGDPGRFIGPFTDMGQMKSAYFMSVNSGKQSLSLNLKKPGGKKILSELIQISDVLVENFRPGKLADLGFSNKRIQELSPGMVYTSVSGFGHSGPMSDQPAFDMIIQALSGLISITGLDKNTKTRVGTSISDIMAGTFAAIGILAVLYRRKMNSCGGHVDIAMLDSSVAILENAVARYQAEKKTPIPIGTRHPSITPFGAFKARDKDIIIAAGNDKLFKDLCRVLELYQLPDDPAYASNYSRTENAEALTDIINSVLKKRDASFWLNLISKAGVPCSNVNTIEDLFSLSQIWKRNMLIPVKDENDFYIAGNPIKIENVPEDSDAGTFPGLGEHNETILKGILRYSDSQIQHLYSEEILFKQN
jgi:CoA:oxalate CoA-transferase